MNSFAEFIMQNQGDFFIDGGRLRFSSRKQNAEFRRGLSLLLDGESADDSCTLQIPGRGSASESADHEGAGSEGWHLLMTRHDVPFEFKNDMQRVVSLMCRKSDRPVELSTATIEKLFRLTPAEARLVKCLVEGDSLRTAAEKLGRLERTARNQLSSIFAKTGVHKQHQLISHILQTASKLQV